MKAVFIGSNSEIADEAWLSIRLRWPDATPLVAITALAGMELVERESPDVVLLHPTFSDMSLAEAGKELRRFSNVPLLVMSHHSGELFIKPATYEVFLGSREVVLTSTEFRLLYVLLKNRGIVVSHRAMERILWGEESDSSGLVKKYIQRLRQKLRIPRTLPG